MQVLAVTAGLVNFCLHAWPDKSEVTSTNQARRNEQNQDLKSRNQTVYQR